MRFVIKSGDACFGPARRQFLLGAAGVLLTGLRPAAANVPVAHDPNAIPPMDSRVGFIDWMRKNRGEDAGFLGQRWDRFQALVTHKDVWDKRDMRAYLMTPREEFVTGPNRGRAYEWHYLDIGYGVTITGPHSVARMTNSLEIHPGDKVLEIGTGSGYQSAYLSNLTDKVFSIEIIKPLAARTRALYDRLITEGYSEYKAITTRNADGYYGWQEEAPFDKIIVTCGIDHIPPPLLKQLKANGMMVIPVGPPGAQHVLKITKHQEADGTFNVVRADIYNGGTLSFVPFTKLEGGAIKGTHNGP
ncbi:protein-L-isoaspartate O-methyltransferase family protein [Mesorhizobium sp. ES1-3]|uniref:protein-L-isoaspartate O-methyltransferase family protein n=1 Tax=Mesorhizobium sp. ES1-3 TaxID=2876628 RepID=UPI001CC9C8B3|nr:protein-L-isoaspartate O-methyltransferase [Mesorhizobium sp. ES1-3]MBZ9670762.1 protein-L-isoaspartate O-methyltransferase [Mesorhizobium sp. ES1-3]